MVNSKKMSKSSVAVIVLAILLVLSMVLGLTGAYFTAEGSTGSSTGGTVTIRKGWLELQVSGNAGGVEGASDNAMPGDVITVTDATYAIKAKRVGDYTGDVKAYVFLVPQGAEIANDTESADDDLYTECVTVTIATGEQEKAITFTNLDNSLEVTGSILISQGEGKYMVNPELGYEAAGQSATIGGLGGFDIVAIQFENLATEADAWEAAKSALNA